MIVIDTRQRVLRAKFTPDSGDSDVPVIVCWAEGQPCNTRGVSLAQIDDSDWHTVFELGASGVWRGADYITAYNAGGVDGLLELSIFDSADEFSLFITRLVAGQRLVWDSESWQLFTSGT